MGDVKLDAKQYTIDALEQKYRNFFAPAFEILVDGSNISNEIAVNTVKVDTSIDSKADSCSFQVVNAFDLVKRDFKWLDNTFVVGKAVEIKMGYVDKLVTVFSGYITSVSVDLQEDEPPSVNVRGMDISFLMMKGAKSKSWSKKKYSDVVSEIGKKYGATMKVDATKSTITTIAQNKQTDFHFLQYLAGLVNYDFFVVGKTIYFRKPLTEMTPVVTLEWGTTLRSLSVDMNIAEQITEVVVRGWDDKKLEVIEAKSTTIQKLGSNSKTGKDIMKTLGEYSEYVYTNVESKEEALDKANAMLNKRAMKLVSGSGECVGIPEIRAGRYISIKNVGSKLSQPYYLTSVSHSINQSGYVTKFQVEGNAV